MGIVAGLYLSIMGVTGSLLVFRPELNALHLPKQWRALRTSSPVNPGAVVARLHADYPAVRIVSLEAPSAFNPTFVATLSGAGRTVVTCDPTTGVVLGPVPPAAAWLTFVRRLHETLLIGGSGRTWNGVGAALLLLLAATGLGNWWPGVRNWRRALRVGLRFGWRRINFDLHRAAGFWALLLLTSWAVSGIYFAWTRPVFALVNSWSPIVSARPPAVVATPSPNASPPDLNALIARASAIDPGTRWSGIFSPSAIGLRLRSSCVAPAVRAVNTRIPSTSSVHRRASRNVAIRREREPRRLVCLAADPATLRHLLGAAHPSDLGRRRAGASAARDHGIGDVLEPRTETQTEAVAPRTVTIGPIRPARRHNPDRK